MSSSPFSAPLSTRLGAASTSSAGMIHGLPAPSAAKDFGQALAHSVSAAQDKARQGARHDQAASDTQRRHLASDAAAHQARQSDARRLESGRAEANRQEARRNETQRPTADKSEIDKTAPSDGAAKADKAKPAERLKEEPAEDRVAQAFGLLGLAVEPAARLVSKPAADARPENAEISASGTNAKGAGQLAATFDSTAGLNQAALPGTDSAQETNAQAGTDHSRSTGITLLAASEPGSQSGRADAAHALSREHASAAQALPSLPAQQDTVAPQGSAPAGTPSNAAGSNPAVALSASGNAPATAVASAKPRTHIAAQGLAVRTSAMGAAGNVQRTDVAAGAGPARLTASHGLSKDAAASSAASPISGTDDIHQRQGAHGSEGKSAGVFSLSSALPDGTTASEQAGTAVSAARESSPDGASLMTHLKGQLEPEVGTPAWQQALNQQIMQMRRGNANEAELQLNPLGLGPLRIKLSLREQELNAEFSAAHAEVSEALEAALPQLREALQQGGIQLGQAVVDTGAQSGQSGQSGLDESSLAGSGFAGSGTPGQDSQSSRAPSAAHSSQPLRNPPAEALAAHTPRSGQGQRLNTFA